MFRDAVSEYVDPWKLPVILGGIILSLIYCKEVEQSGSPLVTPGSTPGGSTPGSGTQRFAAKAGSE